MIPDSARRFVYYEEKDIVLLHGDCLEILPLLPEKSVDTVITDPPYGLAFMGQEWDKAVPGSEYWTEILRVVKPGAMLMAFGGTRFWHRLAVAIEDAGWEIRDTLMWLYGSGFPKSLDISKAIDKVNGRFYNSDFQGYCNKKRIKKGLTHQELNRLMGLATNGGGFSSSIMGNKSENTLPTLKMYQKLKEVLELDGRFDELILTTEAEREIIGLKKAIPGVAFSSIGPSELDITAPATPEAQLWNGWGTALKPAWEPILLAMKPLDGTFAQNALKHGVAGLNIDGGRIGEDSLNYRTTSYKEAQSGEFSGQMETNHTTGYKQVQGRFPANLLLDEESAELLDEQSGESISAIRKGGSGSAGLYDGNFGNNAIGGFTDSGGASRFFYIAKADNKDRGNREEQKLPLFDSKIPAVKNTHPTVKPSDLITKLIELNTYLARLTKTPTGGVILDSFAGTCTMAIAARRTGRPCICIEIEKKYLDIAVDRLRQEVLV